MRKTIGASEGSSILLLGVCVSNLLSMFVMLFFRGSSASFDGMPTSAWVGYVIMQVGFLAAAIVYGLVRKLDIPAVSRIRRPAKLSQLLLAPFIAIATILVFFPFANLWQELLDLMHFDGAGVTMPAFSNVGVYFLSLFVMAILPAFGEELIVRGNALSGLSTRNVWFGVLISALMFSLMHANPMQTVHQFGLGVVLALSVLITDSLFMGVLIHFFNNFISITLTAYLPQVDRLIFNLGAYNWLTGIASVAVGLFLLASLLFVLWRLGGGKCSYFADYSIRLPEDYKPSVGFFKALFCKPYRDMLPTVTRYYKSCLKGGCRDYVNFLHDLFTKQGWRDISTELLVRGDVSNIGKDQPLIGVWITIGLLVVYWLYAFISGLI